jgi:hypothetical protein
MDELSKLPCYETFSGGNVAFQRDGRFYFGPIAKLAALLSGSDESFLVDDAAEAKVAELQAQQDRHYHSALAPDYETDNLATTRKRWERERSSGQWEKKAKPGD